MHWCQYTISIHPLCKPLIANVFLGKFYFEVSFCVRGVLHYDLWVCLQLHWDVSMTPDCHRRQNKKSSFLFRGGGGGVGYPNYWWSRMSYTKTKRETEQEMLLWAHVRSQYAIKSPGTLAAFMLVFRTIASGPAQNSDYGPSYINRQRSATHYLLHQLCRVTRSKGVSVDLMALTLQSSQSYPWCIPHHGTYKEFKVVCIHK